MVHRVCRTATVLRTAVLRRDRCEKTEEDRQHRPHSSIVEKRIFGKAGCNARYSLLSCLNCCGGQGTLLRASVSRNARRVRLHSSVSARNPKVWIVLGSCILTTDTIVETLSNTRLRFPGESGDGQAKESLSDGRRRL